MPHTADTGRAGSNPHPHTNTYPKLHLSPSISMYSSGVQDEYQRSQFNQTNSTLSCQASLSVKSGKSRHSEQNSLPVTKMRLCNAGEPHLRGLQEGWEGATQPGAVRIIHAAFMTLQNGRPYLMNCLFPISRLSFSRKCVEASRASATASLCR